MDLIELNPNQTKRHPWELARKSIITHFIKKLSPGKGNSIDILDIGSGDAYLATNFAEIDFVKNVHCVDINYTKELKDKINNTFKNDKLKLYTVLEKVPLKNITLVALLDVIEHVENDVALIKYITNRLCVNSDISFIITVPAFQSLFSDHDVALKHYRRYNLKQLKSTLKEAGLKVEEGGYFFFSLLLIRQLQLLKRKLSKKHNKATINLGNWNGSNFTTTFIKTILLLDFKLSQLLKIFSITIPGLSCYAICRKGES